MIGQPNLQFDSGSRRRRLAIGINVSDVQDAIETAVGGKAVSQVLAGRAALRPGGALSGALPQHQGSDREHPAARALRRARFARRSCAKSRFSTALRKSTAKANSRYVAIKYSVRGRDLGSAVEEAIAKVNQTGETAARLSHRMGGRI